MKDHDNDGPLVGGNLTIPAEDVLDNFDRMLRHRNPYVALSLTPMTRIADALMALRVRQAELEADLSNAKTEEAGTLFGLHNPNSAQSGV